MARVRTSYICRSCASVHPRWMGKCPDCDSWDSLEAHRESPAAARDPQREGVREVLGAWGDAPEAIAPPEARPLADAPAGAPPDRVPTGVGEFDRVLGGGLVRGSVVLLGGDPGIGKSTLLLQTAGAMARRGARTLYVTSEESEQQVRLRATRLGVTGAEAPRELFVLADTNLARILEQARRVAPAVMVVDSVQMIYRGDIDASPGSVAQLRRCCTDLVYLAKSAGVAVLLVGHVTKDGALAGPRLIEHLVDVVLQFEGDRHHAHRIVRGLKNRFGATQEVGIFEMLNAGLRESPEGAGVAAEGETRPGSIVCPVLTGSRCVLVEVQALTATGFPGSTKRKASGVDTGRLAMLIAVLEQHAGLRLADRDVFASAVGGIRVGEPAADLALALAVAGAHLKRSLPPASAAMGEVGLGGEVRPVTQPEMRLCEAARLGYTSVIIPKSPRTPPAPEGVRLTPVATIGEAVEALG